MENVREIALKALTRVLSDQRPLDDAIEELARGLEGSQRAWLVDVCSGVLRHKSRLDSIIDSLSLKKKPSGFLRKILLMAAYQILEQDRSEPALVVNDTVGLVKKREGAAPSQFVNALLRRVSEHRQDWKNAPAPGIGDSDEIQAKWYSLPLTWWKRLEMERGIEWVREFALAALARPEIWIKLKTGAVPREFMEEGPVVGSYRIKAERPTGSLRDWPGLSEGEWIVQDLASQILVKEAAQIVFESLKEPRVLDRCAAPGGKSVALAWEGATTFSTDIGAGRMALLRETSERTKNAFQVIEAANAMNGEYDWIWVDAPCSGSGILRRHPDVKWLKETLQLADLIQKQKRLVQETYEKLHPGGFLSYSVCSVFFDEGRGVLNALKLSDQIVKEWNLAPHGSPSTDGFYGALIRKK